MKCNLVPASYRQDHRRWQRPACLALGLMLVVCAGAGLFFQYQIQREKAYYTDYLYPVQQQIQQRNDAIRRSQALADRAKKGPASAVAADLAAAGHGPGRCGQDAARPGRGNPFFPGGEPS